MHLHIAQARLAIVATGCSVPYDTSNGSMTKSGVDSPTTETGSSGSSADRPTASANGMFFELGLNQLFVVGEVEATGRSPRGSHSSSGSDAETV